MYIILHYYCTLFYIISVHYFILLVCIILYFYSGSTFLSYGKVPWETLLHSHHTDNNINRENEFSFLNIEEEGNFIHKKGNIIHKEGNFIHKEGNFIHKEDNFIHKEGNYVYT